MRTSYNPAEKAIEALQESNGVLWTLYKHVHGEASDFAGHVQDPWYGQVLYEISETISKNNNVMRELKP